MKTRDINSKSNGITTDMQPAELVEQTFNFPSLGVSVVAKTMDEALQKAKAIIKSKE
jgi:hypothetical protein